MAVLIITLGTRDVQLNKDDLTPADRKDYETHVEQRNAMGNVLLPARLVGKFILEKDNIEADYLYFPILQEARNKIIKDGMIVNKIILIATDQPAYTTERHRNNDTIEFARVIEKYYHLTYTSPKKAEIIIRPIQGMPTNPDECFRYFKTYCKELKEEINPEEKIFLLPQGGIDAINNALTLNAIKYFNKQLEQIVVQEDKNNQSSEAFKVQFPEIFHQELVRDIIEKAISKYEYSIAIENDLMDKDLRRQIAALGTMAKDRSTLHTNPFLTTKYIKFPNSITEWLNNAETEFNISKTYNKGREIWVTALMYYQKEDYHTFLIKVVAIGDILHKDSLKKIWHGKELKIPPEIYQKIKGEKTPKGEKIINGNHFWTRHLISLEMGSAITQKSKYLEFITGNFLLRDLRNFDAAHDVNYLERDNLNNVFKTNKSGGSLDSFIHAANTFFNIPEPHFYDQLNQHMLDLLDGKA